MEAREFQRVRSLFDLPTFQRRLRHLRTIAVRNLLCKNYRGKDALKLKTYFTLHKNSASRAFYTSEKITGSLNPSWQSFDISRYANDIDATAKSVVVRVWYSHDNKFQLLMDWQLHFSGLVFFADKMQQDAMKYASNTVVFGMFDKFFTAPEIQPDVVVQPSGCKSVGTVFLQVDQGSLHNSYTALSLSRIYTILRAIKQTQASVRRVHHSIEDRLLSSQEKSSKLSEQESLLLRVNQLKNELAWRAAQLQGDRDELGKLQEIAEDKGHWLQSKQEVLGKEQSHLIENKKNYNQTREKLIKENAQLWIRRKQLICELATHIYPVTENEKHGGHICGIHLPNSEEFQGREDTRISVGLGFTCHMVVMISEIMELPLRYKMDHKGSRSLIRDHIHNKLIEKEREFPLFTKGKEKFQFNYGVFLLNKNISQLRYYCGLGTTDLRLTLQNLKSLLELRLGVKYYGPTLMPNSNPGLYDDRKSNSSKDYERTETHSSINSKGRLPDSTDHMFEVMMQGTKLQKQEDTGSDGRSESAISSTWSNPSLRQECNELDESEDLFQATDDTFFKITKPVLQTVITLGGDSAAENGVSSNHVECLQIDGPIGDTDFIKPNIPFDCIDNANFSLDPNLSQNELSPAEIDTFKIGQNENLTVSVENEDNVTKTMDIKETNSELVLNTDESRTSRINVNLDQDQASSPNSNTFKTSAFRTQSNLVHGDTVDDIDVCAVSAD